MLRLYSLLLVACCVPLMVLYMATETTTTQAAHHSLLLNGTSGYLNVPNSASINISGPITVEAWIKVNAITGQYQDIVCRQAWGQAGSGGGYEFAITNNGRVRLDLYQSHNTYTTVVGTTSVSTGAWHHVAGVFDGNQMRVYLNGALDGSLSTTNGPASGTSALNIGKSTYTSYYFNGLIDEVRLSAAALYSTNFTPGLGPASNTRGFWKFDGQTTNDSSGSNHGTLQGAATYSTDVPSTSNNAPNVSVVDPQHSTAFASGSTIVIDATASDSDGSVQRVDFYQGTTLLGSDTSGPYAFSWTNVPSGAYSIFAKATDDDGATTTTGPVSVNVIDQSAAFHSLSLNGTSGYVSVPNSASINISGPITVEAWIKVNAITGQYQDIVCRQAWGQAGSGGGYEFAITNNGKVRLDLYQSHNTYTTVVGTTSVSTGAWHHVAGVFDGNQMRVYLNGALDGSLSTTNGPASGTSALNIGKSTYTSYYFNGLIDEVRLSAAALYSTNFTPGLGPANNTRGFWKFDGQTANDSSGSANHGTLQGGAGYSTNVPAQGGAQRPVAVAGGPYNGQIGQTVQLSSNGSFNPGGTITGYHWSFGDGTAVNSANPAHAYAAPGSYTATLTVTGNTGLLTSSTAVVTISNGADARSEPLNHVGGSGENPLSRNFNWSQPLVHLPGRGMDLGLTLSYNSLVWTRDGNSISFDDDRGFPAPGFRLGFPVIQPLYFNPQTAKYTFRLIGSDGSRKELRQVETSSLYEAADSSHLLLDASTMVLRTTDGTQLSYMWMGSEYNCTQIKDRNGNYLSINYTTFGRIDTIVDTLARVIKFNYNNDGRLTSITQIWNQNSANPVTHNWAVFTYADTAIQTNFPGLTVHGPSNNTTIKTLAKVTMADGSHSDFSYTTWGQVWKVSNYAADHHLLNYRSYNLPQTAVTPQTDAPRFTELRQWSQFWHGDTEGTPATSEEAITIYAEPVGATWTMPDGTQQSGTRAQVTLPDGTSNKIYFIGTAGTASGWRRGLPALVETYEGSTLRRQVVTTWTQDNLAISYPLNPRVTETNIHDPSGSRARTQITYQQFTFTNGTSCWLPRDVYEYAANATAILRSTRTDYNSNASYTARRILGLVSERRLYEGDVNSGGVLMSKVGFFYDDPGSIQGTDAPVQHDNTDYTASFVTGRGNLTSVRRYDVNNPAQYTTTSSKFNTAGAIVFLRDAANHDVHISYSDSFSDGNNTRNTLAYATTITNPDGYSATAKYNFDFGAVTSRRTPQPNVVTNTPGPEQTFTFDGLGRLQQVTNNTNNFYTRFEYPTTQIRIDTYTTIQDGQGESHSFRLTDGSGRVIATAADHPGSVGGFSGQKYVYDVLGRLIKWSNPAETNASGAPSQWTTAGDDAATGWVFTEQTLDWKGRPLITTNQDGTTRTASYIGCGCAGGSVITLTDEGTVEGGVAKRRQQKIYHDVFGRPVKSEILNWEGSNDVYSTTVNTYNARDQVTQIRQYAGPEGSTSYVDTILTFDGFGRLKTSQAPHQRPEPNNSASSDRTTFNYNVDDSIASIVDARGVVKSFTYNNRGLVTGVQYDSSNIPASYNNVTATGPVSLTYDAAGNRISMADDSGTISYQYDSLSQLTSETRQFAGPLSGSSFSLHYLYTIGGELKKITDHTNTTINYSRDRAGRVTDVTGEGNLVGGVSAYASSFQYRAWGALKQLNLGNGTSQAATFNSRLLPVSATLGNLNVAGNQNATFSWTYEYFADGRQRRALDANDDHFDRAWEYDHAGRLKEAYSGREARGLPASSPVADSPYRQTFQYNAFNQRTEKAGRFWRTAQSGTTPCLPRQANDGCDAEGNVLTHLSRVHIYDAAGKQRNFFNWQFTVGGSPNHPDLQPGVEIAQIYDGEGQVAKRVETRRTEELVSGGPNTNIAENTTTTYYLYSSVLDGAKLVELNANGQKVVGYVYANGTRLARQDNSGGSGAVEWHHSNLGGHGWVVTTSDRSASREEMDPDGAEVGTDDPWASVLEPATYENLKDEEPLYIEGGDPFDFSGGHTIDGLPVTDAEFMRRMGNGSAAGQLSANGRPLVTFTNQTNLTTISIVFDVFQAASQRSMSETSEHIGTLKVNFSFQDRRTSLQRPAPGVQFLRDKSGNTSYAPSKERMIIDAILALYSDECINAFQAAGLADPFTQITADGYGVVIGPATLAMDSDNTSYMGVPEQARKEILAEVGSSSTKAITVMGKHTTDGRARVFLNTSAFSKGLGGLVSYMAHEFIHAGGVKGVRPPWYKPWQDDLSFDDKYQGIIDTCREAATSFIETRR